MNHLGKLAIFTIIGTVIGAGFYFEYSGNIVVEPALAQTEKIETEPQPNTKEKIYTQADFNGHGRSDEANRAKNILHVEINPQLSPFTFLVNSFTQNSRGQILVFHNSAPKPIQIINLEYPDMFLGDRIHEFFNATDINFDGYLDIGVIEEGGTKWGAYHYWIFDKNTNTFVENNFTQAFRELNFNQIIFDEKKKQIITNNFCGTLICFKDIYQVQNDKLILLEEYEQEQIYEYDFIVKKCVTTVTRHIDGKSFITTKIDDNYCAGYYES